MTERLRRAGQVSWAVVGVAALLAIVALIVWTLRVVLPPLILASTIVFLLNPAVSGLQRRRVPRAAGAGITYLAVVGVIVAAGVLLVPLAGAQARELSREWPGIKARTERWVDDRAQESKGRFWEFDRKELGEALSSNELTVRQQFDRALKLGAAVFNVLLIVVLAPIIAFYLLVDLPHIRQVSVSLIPVGAKDEVLLVSHRLNRAVGGFFRGQLMVAAIVGVLCSIGLLAIGLRFWFLVGMIAGFFNIIPLIGPWVGGLPGVVIALTTGSPLQALGVVLIMVGVQQVDNHFITPQVMHRAVQLHPAAVVLALLAGGHLGGFMGLLFAVPVAAALKIVVGHVWRVHVLAEPLPQVSSDQDEERGPGLVKPVVSREEEEPATATAP
ncbi:MAG: AI-2E family transporter [Actinomycetota bacterium]|nr:AI-2E family transporter [Actinomycetota bacterium]MDQ3574865.1 AI-2E family transporter [Actinomycetota bacterium]